MLNFNTIFGPADAPSRQIPPKMLADEFGEVSVRNVDDRLQVAAALAMGAFIIGDGEKCLTGLALDASHSMKNAYGRGSTLPREVSEKLVAEGKYKVVEVDGVTRRVIPRELREEAIRKGLVRPTTNVVEEPTCRMIESMIRTFATGGVQKGACEIIYWACGQKGDEIEPLGEIAMPQMQDLKIEGPRQMPFGLETHLAPPFRYFAERAKNVSGIFVFVTDGHIDDETEVVQLTHQLAAEMGRGERPSVKSVLIGIGSQVDVEQFDRIDDMEMPPDLEQFDIWNSKVFKEMRTMDDAWSEIFDPETEVASSAVVYDDQGEIVFQEKDSVKALIVFDMPATCQYFDLVIEGDMKIHQTLPQD